MTKIDESYPTQLQALQVDLVKAQAWAIESGQKLLVLFEGRDAAGKDGTIRRVIEHQSPRSLRVVALPKPSDRERSQWYFQRYVPHLPAAGEWVIFNRSWYNRGGVEPVMGFCSPQEHERFLVDVPAFEKMLVEADIKLVKLWLDISKDEQAERLAERRADPLKLLKTSPLDAEAQKRWDAYTRARDQMLTRTHTDFAPWTVVRNNKKKHGRLEVMKHLLRVIGAPGANKVEAADSKVLFTFEPDAITDGRLQS